MIKKIVTIKNVGRFDSYGARGDVELQKFNLIFAENGRGKTTVCDILRSLQSGVPSHVSGRRRLGSIGDPEVSILTSAGLVSFKTNGWTKAFPEIAIFDSTFIHANVFTGDCVDHEHRRNLYRIIVGEQGVVLSADVDALDGKSREAQKDLTAKKTALERHVPKGMPFEDFVKLAPDPEVEQKIKAKEEALATAKTAVARSAEIKSKGFFQRITLPTLPETFHPLLAKTFESVSADAAAQVRIHLEAHTRNASEAWIAQGIPFILEDDCPFCGQALNGVTLIASFKAFFDAAYLALIDELNALLASVGTNLGEQALLPATRSLGTNSTLAEFWGQFGVPTPAAIDLETVARPQLAALRDAATRLVRLKLASPFAPVVIPSSFTAAFDAYATALRAVAAYNDSLQAADGAITAQKAQAAGADPTKLATELQQLKAVQTRVSQPVILSWLEYTQASITKTKLEDEKTAAKAKLDAYSDTVITRYEKRINELLDMFGAGFRIGNTKRSYVGGKTSSTYHLLINGKPVELGDNSTPVEKASFRNTLSTGDKSTLALVFFIAQLEHDQKLGQKVLIFDDPFTSQDRSRRACTKEFICRLSKKSSQTIVLSHDPYFLRDLWDASGTSAPKALQFARMGNGTNISEWDIENDTRGDYAKTHRELWRFLHHAEGDPKSIARSIRPLLEKYLRLKLPGEFPDDEWLGDFIKKIREAEDSDPVAAAKVILADVESINDYSKRYHHNTNASSESEPVDTTELETFVRRTLKLVGAF